MRVRRQALPLRARESPQLGVAKVSEVRSVEERDCELAGFVPAGVGQTYGQPFTGDDAGRVWGRHDLPVIAISLGDLIVDAQAVRGDARKYQLVNGPRQSVFRFESWGRELPGDGLVAWLAIGLAQNGACLESALPVAIYLAGGSDPQACEAKD